jgi:hypothetical protein
MPYMVYAKHGAPVLLSTRCSPCCCALQSNAWQEGDQIKLYLCTFKEVRNCALPQLRLLPRIPC